MGALMALGWKQHNSLACPSNCHLSSPHQCRHVLRHIFFERCVNPDDEDGEKDGGEGGSVSQTRLGNSEHATQCRDTAQAVKHCGSLKANPSTALPPSLPCRHGQRFLSFLMLLHVPLLREIVIIIRNQIPGGEERVLAAYSAIIFDAWKKASRVAAQAAGNSATVTTTGRGGKSTKKECDSNEGGGECGSAHVQARLEIEYGCVQGLVEAAVHARLPQLGTAIRKVLGGFADEKLDPQVGEMLLRICEPIVFRSMQVRGGEGERGKGGGVVHRVLHT